MTITMSFLSRLRGLLTEYLTNRAVLLAIVVYIIGSLADILSTAWAVSLGAKEVNPLVASLMGGVMGETAPVWAKVFVFLFAILMMGIHDTIMFKRCSPIFGINGVVWVLVFAGGFYIGVGMLNVWNVCMVI